MNFKNYASCFLQSIQQKTKGNVFLKSSLCTTLSHPVHIISGGWLAATMKSLKHNMKHVVATVVQFISIPTDVSCVSSGSNVITVYSAFGVDFFFWVIWHPVSPAVFLTYNSSWPIWFYAIHWLQFVMAFRLLFLLPYFIAFISCSVFC